jgi:small subunit ribosomal protein S17
METVRNARKEIVGVVASAKMDKTIVVAVVRNVKHPKYGKYFKKTKWYERYRSYHGDSSSEQDKTLQIGRNRRKS